VASQALVTEGGVRLQVLLEFVGLAPAETTARMLRSLADVGRHARRGTRVALSPPLEQQSSPGGTVAVPRRDLRRVRRMRQAGACSQQRAACNQAGRDVGRPCRDGMTGG